MSIYDIIANAGSTMRPGAAFLVGREQKRQRERQEAQDKMDDETVLLDQELKTLQIEAMRNPTQSTEWVDLTPEQKRGLGIPDNSFAQRSTKTGQVKIDDPPRSGPLVSVNAFDPEARNRETKASRDKIRDENEKTDALLGEVSIAIGRNRAVPGAAGVRGAGAELVEGTLGQLPGVGPAASAAAERVTGVNAKEISQIRTQGRLLVARLVPVVTGDTSGRYTEQEQARTKEVESQLQTMKTADQIEGALSEVQAITLRGQVRKRGMEFINSAAGKEINLETRDGINAWGNILVEKYNLSKEDATEELRRHLIMVGAL